MSVKEYEIKNLGFILEQFVDRVESMQALQDIADLTGRVVNWDENARYSRYGSYIPRKSYHITIIPG